MSNLCNSLFRHAARRFLALGASLSVSALTFSLPACGPTSPTEDPKTQAEPLRPASGTASATASVPTAIEFFPDRPRVSLLIADGKALPVILPENPAPHTRHAANFLAENIEKISGVRPEVIESLPDPLPEQAIWVGYQHAMDGLFPGVDFTFNHPEEIVLAVSENHVAITGRDRWDPKHTDFEADRASITEMQQEYGTANAVFTFLQDVIGVRWLYPGELGTDYPGVDSLQVRQLTYRYHPQFRARVGLFAQFNRGSNKVSVGQNWVKHQRLLLDSLFFEGGHPLKKWWEKYGETRPEIFALQPDGTRGTHPSDPESMKFSEGEPALWQTWLDEMEGRFARYPYWEALPAVANDGYYNGHCTDPRSRAWDPDPSETDVRIELTWANGHKESWPPLSDRYASLANKLSELAAERFPDREYFVVMNAYGEVGRPAPVKTKLRDNILLLSVHNFHMRHPSTRKVEMQQFADWADLTKNIIWRPNLGNQAGLQWGFPDVPFQQTMEDFRFVAEHGAIGIFFDMFFENWANLAPYYYLTSQLAWNPYADGNAILADYFERCYGPAAPAMTKYWLFLEKTRQHFVDSVETPFRLVRVHEYYTDEVWNQAEAFLQEAERLTEGEAKYVARVNFTRCGFIYAQALVEQRALMAKYEAGKASDKELEETIRNKWAALGETVAAFPEAAVRFKRMESPRRAAGLHPGAPTSNKMRRADRGLDLD